MEERYDVLIIGSGLGGLICGYILAREGYKIGILEKNRKIGGCLQSFRRNGVVFDTGIHYVGSLDEGQVLHQLFRYLGIMDRLNVRRLDSDGFDIISIDQQEYKYAMGYENFKATLGSYFPEEQKNIAEYAQQIKQVADSIDLYNLREINDQQWSYTDFFREKAFDYISSITQNRRLRQVLSGLNALYAGEPHKSSLYMHAVINNHYIESAYRFVDGVSQVAELLAENIRKMGGSIITHAKARKFVFRNQKLEGVSTEQGGIYLARYVISDIHPSNTMQMIEPGMIRKAYRKRLENLENTISAFTLYIVLKDGCIPSMNYNYYHYSGDQVWAVSNYSTESWPQVCAIFPVAGSKDARYTRGLSVMTYMTYDEVKAWEHTKTGRRGEDYQAFKNKKARQLLDYVEQAIPGIQGCIDSYYAATPLTLRDYTGTPSGSMYGVARDAGNPMKSFLFPQTKIPNLFLTGQNLNLHGMLGVSIGALLTCREFVDINQLIKKINHA